MPVLTRAHAEGVAQVSAAGGTAPVAELDIRGATPAVYVAGFPVIPAMITYWRPSETAHQTLVEYPEEHEYVRDPDIQQICTLSSSLRFIFPFLNTDVQIHL